MPSHDETVSRERITRIMLHIRREGWEAMFGVLEHQEPALAAYALAMADLVAEKLSKGGAPISVVRCVQREMIMAELVCIESMRQASRELWKDFLPDPEPETKG
jgi:hypothetical protein